MKTADLDYSLPEELIAQHPAEKRDASRLLVLDRAAQTIREDVYRHVAAYLRPGDCMVLNDTRVIRARLHGRKPTGGQVEVFLLHEEAPCVWTALVRPSARVKRGTTVLLSDHIAVMVEDVLPNGQRRVRFDTPDVIERLERVGEIPLPPYIRREHPDDADGARYQTIYAQAPGAVAAPTAGLHFTEAVFRDLDARGIRRVGLTLHVGYGTFRPIMADDIEEHVVESEEFTFPEATAAALNETRAAGGRVVAVGTTATRVLETQYRDGAFVAGAGVTNRYIYPPYTFRAVDVLQTNFHLPRSSLLALVCAFAGRDFVLDAYRYAVEHRFRFYSYGDVMLIR
ncbi:MAG TPA: tRNA preQ1(34) S-adenosylmethionine ribosyltransferase-isomerase QueA [Candidatus Hydrogenedentes bacterium]|nr:tRNA preQ1(34) S-adenosylmethionine ribosyltransferase-isomerase QueA [Candidatus Hydrogenedentota bacterium]HPG70067.1 tRNA preQ1(34) S-adenosylmethionine ribosyltransferase-isomerase QueA [Candidatus Hydrogenedentota bacterium]